MAVQPACPRQADAMAQLAGQGRNARMPGGVDRKRDIHFGDVHLNAQCREACDVPGNALRIRLQIENVHLHPDPVNRNAARLEVFHHCMNCVGLRIRRFGVIVVLEQQGLRIGFLRPAEDLFE